MRLSFNTGFTLTELLVGLGILGLIAAFAVPKVLTASGAALANAKVHKAAQAVVNGYEKWTQENGRNPTTTPVDVMTFVQHNGRITDGSKVDGVPSWLSSGLPCVADPVTGINGQCYRMPDGSILWFLGNQTASANYSSFGSGNAYNSLHFGVDPDGIYTAGTSKDSNSMSTAFFLSLNGRLRERGRAKGGPWAGETKHTPDYYQQ